ncbi:MAG: GNAT family N-acetyltransferase [Candidatus Diapherotrites archaeon]
MIRPAKKSESEELTRIILQYFPYTKATVEKVEKRLKSEKFLLFVDKAEKLRGFFELEFLENECRLNGIAVYPEFRRKGIGKALMERALEEVRKRKCLRIFLLVRPDNKEAIELYEQFDFKEKGFWPKLVDGKQVLEMELKV